MTGEQRAVPRRIRRLIGIYRYDGGLELVGGRLRGEHCALRALTHRGLRPNPEWSAMRAELIVPVMLTHLDRSPTPVRRAAGHLRPAVLAESRTGPVLLLGPHDLDRIEGRVALFLDEVRRAAAQAGLRWTLGMHDSSLSATG